MRSDETSVKLFERVYDRYSPTLYAIALQLTTTEQEAEEILARTFQKFHDLNLYQQDPSCLCSSLIRLLIYAARQRYNGKLKAGLKLKQFESTPILHDLLLENLSIENFCRKSKLTKKEAALKIRREFNVLRK